MKIRSGKILCLVAVFCVAAAVCASAQTFTTMLTFDQHNGKFPLGPLVQGSNGSLLGTSEQGGKDDLGTIFGMTTEGTETFVYGFCASAGCPVVPEAPIVQDSNGNFYGTTESGGSNGFGTVFQISSSGQLTTLYNFCSQTNCTDGKRPTSGLVRGVSGNLYGTTIQGGSHSTPPDYRGGTVFEITPSGKLTTLYSFCGIVKVEVCLDGEEPSGGLVLGSDGNFYGTTELGGANFGTGSIFKITPTGQLKQIYSFCVASIQCPDGADPRATLIEGNDGNYYGTTWAGGMHQNGSVFKVTPTGQLTTLYSFCSQSNCADGENPSAALVQGTDGNFYGTAYEGGNQVPECNDFGCGTLFQVTPAGIFTLLYSFCSQSNCSDGYFPVDSCKPPTEPSTGPPTRAARAILSAPASPQVAALSTVCPWAWARLWRRTRTSALSGARLTSWGITSPLRRASPSMA